MKLPLYLLVTGAIGLSAALGAVRSSTRGEPDRQTTYYANGQVRSDTEIEGGRKNGLHRRFQSDGTPIAEGRYEDGEMEGRWTCWLPDGSVDAAKSGLYANGVRIAD